MNGLATYLAFALSFVVFGGVFSQSLSDTISLSTAEVAVVKKDKISPSASIDYLLMQSMPGSSVGDYLQKMGYNVLSYGPPGSIQLWRPDGLPPEYAQIKWNGAVMNSPGLAQADLSLIPVYILGESGNFNAGNPISNIDSHPPKKNRLFASWNSSSLNNNRFTGLFDYHLKKWNFGLQSSFGILKNEFEYNDRLKPSQDAEIQEHNDVNELQLNPSVEFKQGKHTFSTEYWFTRKKLELPSTLGSYGSSDAIQQDSIHRAAFSWNFNSQSINIGSQLVYANEYQSYQSNLQSTGEYLIDSEIQSNRLMAAVFIGSEQSALKWKLSFRPEIWMMNTENYTADEITEKRTQAALELEREIRGFKIEIDARMSNAGSTKWMPDYSLKVERKLLEKANFQWTTSLAGSRIFRWPSFNERYWSPGGNPEIKPENGFRLEHFNMLEYSFLGCDIELETSLWNAVISDRVLWLPEDQVWTAENLDSYHSKGGKVLLNVWKKKEKFSYFARASYSNTLSKIEQDILMPYAPRHRYSVHAGISSKSWGFNLGAVGSSLRYADFSMNQNTSLPSYQNVQSEVSKSWRFGDYQLNLALQVDNIFNVQYEQVRLRPMPGRVFQITTSFQFNP